MLLPELWRAFVLDLSMGSEHASLDSYSLPRIIETGLKCNACARALACNCFGPACGE
jgi:hypothetical protein